MTRRTYEYSWEEHREHGWWGWKPQWMPQADPLGAMAVVHDMLEHLPGDTGTVTGEFMAFGAMLHVRRYFWELRGSAHAAPYVHIASEFPDQEQYAADNPASFFKIDKPEPPIKSSEGEWVEDQIAKVIKTGTENIKDQWYRDDLSLDEQTTTLDMEQVRYWMRRGYRRALQRFRRHDPYDMSCYFSRIETAVEDAQKHTEHIPEMYLLRLLPSFEQLTCRVNVYENRSHLSQPRWGYITGVEA